MKNGVLRVDSRLMFTTHIDIEVFIDAINEFTIDPIKNSKDFIDFITIGCDSIYYGLNKDTPIESVNILTKVLENGGENAKSSIRSSHYKIDNQFESISNPYQSFFLNISEKPEQLKISNHLNLLVGYITNYQHVFAKFKNESSFRIDNNAKSKKFVSWEQILPNLPVTEIIISDPYLFECKEDEVLLKENYYKLIQSINDKYANRLKNLLIFSSIQDITKLNEIRERSNEILGVKIGIVLFHHESEHDRHIFLNYNHIKIGSSLNFLFDNTGNLVVKKKSTVKVESYFNPDNYDESLSVLEYLKRQLFEMKKLKKIPYYINSNLLNPKK